jgi:hypothetical protein
LHRTAINGLGSIRSGSRAATPAAHSITSSARASSEGGTSRPSAATRRNARHPGWVALGLKVSPEPTSARRCGSPSPLCQPIRRWREHLSPSSRRSPRFQTNFLPRQRPVSQRRRPYRRVAAGLRPVSQKMAPVLGQHLSGGLQCGNRLVATFS